MDPLLLWGQPLKSRKAAILPPPQPKSSFSRLASQTQILRPFFACFTLQAFNPLHCASLWVCFFLPNVSTSLFVFWASAIGCCPRGWLTFHTSCYWTTLSRGTWEEAKKDCEEKKAHLVILNSANEKAFVKTHRLGSNTWIGLTDSSGDWKWVDGSSYTVDPKDWGPGQPDHWYGHGLGGGEDCAHMREDALWNDNICSRTFTWVCEMELGI
uniref:C-type lectin domain-containing protein n=1 Tax=Pseudonaja textilis TaxID=8673 RepID=A0A670Z755_PSETE